MTYAPDRLFEEVAYVAYYLHWPFEQILDMEHPLRARIIDEQPYSFIAAEVRCSESVIRQRVSRGLATLRRIYEEEDVA